MCPREMHGHERQVESTPGPGIAWNEIHELPVSTRCDGTDSTLTQGQLSPWVFFD